MSNSPLVTYRCISPNCTKPRSGTIKGVAIHCMAAPLSVEVCGSVFQKRKASSHYGIGTDGRIGQYVDEKDRAWCTSHKIDHEVVTIEMACEKEAPYRVTDKAYLALIDLLVDICRRNGINRLLWRGNKALMGQWDKQNMVVHRWTANKACPGDWLYSRHGEIAEKVNARLNGSDSSDSGGQNRTEREDSMNGEEIYRKLNGYLKAQPVPEWAKAELEEAVKLGITDGENPCELVPRYQAAVMAVRVVKTAGNR